MYGNIENDDNKRQEVISHLYWSLMENWNIPEAMQDYYELTEDYRTFHMLGDMDPAEYRQKRADGEVPDILEVDARLTKKVERILEQVCGRPPAPYLDKLNDELTLLGRIAVKPAEVVDPIHIRPDFLAKYGIDRNDPPDVCSKKAEKAYRELDGRFVRMTGRKPYADDLFSSQTRTKGRKTSI